MELSETDNVIIIHMYVSIPSPVDSNAQINCDEFRSYGNYDNIAVDMFADHE